MTTIREYFITLALLLALAATVYLFIGRELVETVQQPSTRLETQRQ